MSKCVVASMVAVLMLSSAPTLAQSGARLANWGVHADAVSSGSARVERLESRCASNLICAGTSFPAIRRWYSTRA